LETFEAEASGADRRSGSHSVYPVPVLTERDVVAYLSQYGPIPDRFWPLIPRWLRRLHELGIDTEPLALGSNSARHVDLLALQASKDANPEAAMRAHDIRDTMPEIRPYKGRRIR